MKASRAVVSQQQLVMTPAMMISAIPLDFKISSRPVSQNTDVNSCLAAFSVAFMDVSEQRLLSPHWRLREMFDVHY